ncbi:MAG: mitochondrial fission ELM1 family protein [Candidatus Omnitrophica bacterium]|nr:mitochondrial fission ELM1 family protein [Candidatus Omnitrophota bacterium]
MIDWLACVIVRVVGWLLCRLPPGACVRLGMGLGWLASWAQPKRMRVGVQNLRAAYGERPIPPPVASPQATVGHQADVAASRHATGGGMTPARAARMARQVFAQLGAGFMEMLRLPAIDQAYVERYIQFQHLEHYTAGQRSGRPVIVLTGHLGNWELCSIAGALADMPVLAVARAQDNLPRLYRLLVSYRESKGCRIVHKGGAVRQLLRALHRREVVAIVADQASRQGRFVEFFGRPALFASGPFEMAWSANALLLPVFIHRVRGAYHRIEFEPLMDLRELAQDKSAGVRQGIEQFAGVLRRHIERDPAQWLWLHKRWKHTPTRRVLVLSDGKLGHVKQSFTVLQAIAEHVEDCREQVVEVRYRSRAHRALAVAWAGLMPGAFGAWWCLRRVLTAASWTEVAAAGADLVISCGAATAPVARLAASANGAKAIVIMNPAPVPLSRFALAFVPAHDRVETNGHVVRTRGAVSRVTPEGLRSARERLRRHPQFRPPASSAWEARPMVALIFGGDTDLYQMTTSFAEALVRQVLAVCEAHDLGCLVTTSRRTPAAVEQLLTERLGAHPRCWLLLRAGRDPLQGTLEGMLGWARVAVVTGESVSMVSEACASGCHVIVVEPPLRRHGARRLPKPRRLVQELSREGYLHLHPLPEVGHAVRRCLSEEQPPRRLDTYAQVRDAVKRVL